MCSAPREAGPQVRALAISPETVATRIRCLLSKLGVNSREQAIAAAHHRGLVASDVTGHAFLSQLDQAEPDLSL